MSSKVSGTGGDEKSYFEQKEIKREGSGMEAEASHVSKVVGKKGKPSEIKAQIGSKDFNYNIKDVGSELTEQAKGTFSFRKEYKKIIDSVNNFFEDFLKKALIDKTLKDELEGSRESIKEDLRNLFDKIKIGKKAKKGEFSAAQKRIFQNFAQNFDNLGKTVENQDEDTKKRFEKLQSDINQFFQGQPFTYAFKEWPQKDDTYLGEHIKKE